MDFSKFWIVQTSHIVHTIRCSLDKMDEMDSENQQTEQPARRPIQIMYCSMPEPSLEDTEPLEYDPNIMDLQQFEALSKMFNLLQFKKPNPNRKDHLSTLPPELLIKILSNVPLSSYLDLCHTSKTFKKFMRQFGRELCNARILCHFIEAALSLRSCFIEGWITPTISFLHWWERRAVETERRGQWDGCRYLDLDYTFKLTHPGPQLAAILEGGWVAFEGPMGGLEVREDMLKEVLERWNCVWGVRADGRVQRFVKDRRLAWFYGFPALTWVEKTEVDNEEENYGDAILGQEEDEVELADEAQRFKNLRVQLWMSEWIASDLDQCVESDEEGDP